MQLELLPPNPRAKATHRIIVCDTYDYEDYNVFVHEDESVEAIKDKYNGPNMQRVHEIIVIDPPIECHCWRRNHE